MITRRYCTRTFHVLSLTVHSIIEVVADDHGCDRNANRICHEQLVHVDAASLDEH